MVNLIGWFKKVALHFYAHGHHGPQQQQQQQQQGCKRVGPGLPRNDTVDPSTGCTPGTVYLRETAKHRLVIACMGWEPTQCKSHLRALRGGTTWSLPGIFLLSSQVPEVPLRFHSSSSYWSAPFHSPSYLLLFILMLSHHTHTLTPYTPTSGGIGMVLLVPGNQLI